MRPFTPVLWFHLALPVAQSCPTLCDPMDWSLPGSSVHGISRQEYWSELPFPPPGALPTLELDWYLLHCGQALYCSATRKPLRVYTPKSKQRHGPLQDCEGTLSFEELSMLGGCRVALSGWAGVPADRRFGQITMQGQDSQCGERGDQGQRKVLYSRFLCVST